MDATIPKKLHWSYFTRQRRHGEDQAFFCSIIFITQISTTPNKRVHKTVIDNLRFFIQNELGSFFCFEDDLTRLSSTLTANNATLEDAEEKQFTNKVVKDWLQKLKDATYTLDDILDEYTTEALELNIPS
ncbi:disease resistance protein RGA2-like [Arachis ipaensis]|uniref:disease resistance protein RGA2-like n=1 Tax=Arachis ipaensis TaxID=130454 RepID=UPI0007AFC3E3|nr:disease resistance protein RGA2-like [Arachis ipaensis]